MRRILISAFVSLMVFPFHAQAQEIDLPDYTLDQRWTRAAQFSVNGMVQLISLGKEKGMTIEEIGTWMGEFYAPGWGEPPREPSSMIVSFHRNHMTSPNGIVEVLEITESSASARFNAPHRAVFGDDMVRYGITVEEYEKVMVGFAEVIAERLELEVEQRVEGEWMYLKFTKK